MKKIHTLILFICCSFFAGCFDTTEELTLNENATGSYAIKMDMSSAVEMMKGFMPPEEMAKSGLDKPVDTVINFKLILDTAKNVSAEKKELLGNALVRMNIDMEKNTFKMGMDCPFTSLINLNKLYSFMQNGSSMFDMLQALPGKEMPAPAPADSSASPASINSVYDVLVTNNSYSKKINPQRLQKFMSNPKVEELKNSMSMMGEMNFTTVIKLPRAAKLVSNATATLSADKKTITLKNSLTSVFEKPALMEMLINY
jgi:phage anti-repressor protein